VAVLFTVFEIFSHIELKITIFAYCILIVNPLAEERPASFYVIHRWKVQLVDYWHYGSIFIRVAVRCCLPNLWNHLKFRENQNFKVIQSHQLWCQSKVHMQLHI